MSATPLARILALSTTLLAAAACSPPQASRVEESPRIRWFGEEPRVAFTFPARSAPDSAKIEWIPEPFESDRPVELRFAAAVDSDSVAGFELVTTGRLKSPPVLSWTPPAGCTAGAAIVHGDRGLLTGSRAFRYQLVPLFEPCWRGDLGDVRLAIDWEDNDGARVASLVALDARHARRDLRTLHDQNLRIDLRGEVRNGFGIVAGEERTWRIEVPEGARLRFAAACHASCRGRTPLRIAIAAGESVTAASVIEMGPYLPGLDEWREHEIDLGPWAGRAVDITFGVEANARGRSTALIFVGDVELVVDAGIRTEPPSIVMISVDTLRADRMSLYGNSRPTTPNLDRWAARAAVFERAIAQAPWTNPSHVSMLTGLDALRHGVNWELPAGEELTTLAEMLRAKGYRTLGVTGGAWLSRAFGLDQGFDVFRYSVSQADRDVELSRGIRHALSLISERPVGPHFLFFHTYHVHDPHRARSPYFERWSRFDERIRVPTQSNAIDPESGRRLRVAPRMLRGLGVGFEPLPPELAELPYDLYDSAVAEMDEQIGELIRELRHRLGRKRVAFVFTSDHGELLGEHGQGGHVEPYDEVVHVPLIVELPGGEGRSSRISSQVRSIDIVPTLLEMVGAPSERELDGMPLQPLLRDPARRADRPAWTYGATGEWSLALRPNDRSEWLLSLSPWGGLRGRMGIVDRRDGATESDPRLEPIATEPTPPARAMLERVRHLGRGLFVAASAARDAPATIELRIGATPRGAIKLLGAPPRQALVYAGDTLRIELGAAESIELWCEQLRGREVELRATTIRRDGGPWTRLVAPSSGPVVLELTEGGWTTGEPRARVTPPALPRVVLVWRDAAADSAELELDPETESRLRALGYLN